MARKKISTTIYITPEQNELLKALNQKTKVPLEEGLKETSAWFREVAARGSAS